MDRQSIRVLLVEDDEDDYVIVRDLLDEIEHRYIELDWVRSMEQAVRSLDGPYDAIVTDYRLGSFSGLELLHEVQSRRHPAPVILLTGQGDREVDLLAMDAGAADYLVKGELTAALLERSLRYAIQQHELLSQLRSLSLTDELTGLYNRRGFQMLAEAQLRLAEREARPTLILFIDLDGMKGINDRLGHQAGDQALAETAELLRRTFRNSDLCARLGGDEFVVLTVDAAPDSAYTMTERLQHNVALANRAAERRFQLSLSVGEVWCDPADACPLEEMLGRADAVMYEQKQRKHAAAVGGGGSGD